MKRSNHRVGDETVEQALRRSEEKFAKAFLASPDSITIGSVAQGRILELNEGFSRLTGYTRDEALGKTSRDLELWADFDDRTRLIDELQAHGRVRELEAGIRCKSGEIRTCLISAELIEIEGELNLLTVTRDITERKRAEDERLALIRELEAKNAELERFTYTVSHDLKSPLITIRGFLDLLEKDSAAGDVERARDDMRRIREATDKMRDLLDDLLKLSRVGRFLNSLQQVPLKAVADAAVAQVAGQIRDRGVEIEVGELPAVVGDRPRLVEVFQNLVENAVKFMGGQRRPRIEIGERPGSAEQVVCYVRDNGRGIEARDHERIFGLFDRLDPDVEGTGIGLALVKRIVELHDGRVWVESGGLGTGSTFCLALPRPETTRRKSSSATTS